jgi:hypothetical protein
VTSEQHKSLVNRLKAMAERPHLYIGDHDATRASIWLNGFTCAVIAQEQLAESNYQIRKDAVTSRGWALRATGDISQQMAERGMSPQEIIAELVEIEIEFLDRLLNIKVGQTE